MGVKIPYAGICNYLLCRHSGQTAPIYSSLYHCICMGLKFNLQQVTRLIYSIKLLDSDYLINLPSAEEDLGDVIDEVESLAGRWESMCIRLGLLSSDKEAIAKEYHHNSMDCLREMLAKWLKMSYNTQKHGPPSWRKMVAAVANSTGGDNPALAKAIAENHQGESN